MKGRLAKPAPPPSRAGRSVAAEVAWLAGALRRAEPQVQLAAAGVAGLGGLVALISLASLLGGDFSYAFMLFLVAAVLLALPYLLLRRQESTRNAMEAALSASEEVASVMNGASNDDEVKLVCYLKDGWIYGGDDPPGVLIVTARGLVFHAAFRTRDDRAGTALRGAGRVGSMAADVLDAARGGVAAPDGSYQFVFKRAEIESVAASGSGKELLLHTRKGRERFAVPAASAPRLLKALTRHGYPLRRP